MGVGPSIIRLHTPRRRVSRLPPLRLPRNLSKTPPPVMSFLKATREAGWFATGMDADRPPFESFADCVATCFAIYPERGGRRPSV